jgi:hypothetical protein
MTPHLSKGAASVLEEPNHVITATALRNECKNIQRLLPTLQSSSLTSLLYLSVGYMLSEKGIIAAGVIALSCLLLKAGIYLANLIIETLHRK